MEKRIIVLCILQLLLLLLSIDYNRTPETGLNTHIEKKKNDGKFSFLLI